MHFIRLAKSGLVAGVFCHDDLKFCLELAIDFNGKPQFQFKISVMYVIMLQNVSEINSMGGNLCHGLTNCIASVPCWNLDNTA